MEDKIKKFLEFRKQFTKREWVEMNQIIDMQFNRKADELELTDQDINEIANRLERTIR